MVSRVSACCPLRIYLCTHTEKQVVVSGVSACWVFLCIYIYTHRERNRLWYLGIQGISLLSSPYISINAYRETGCGILVSRVSVCWVFLCIHLYTHTERQAVVSGYPGYQSAVLSIYISTHIQRNRSWYLGIQGTSLLSSPYISIDTQRDKRWYLGIQCICMLGFSACIYTHIWVSSVSIWWVFMYVSIQTCRETNCSIWVSRVSKCRFCLYRWTINTHKQVALAVSGY